MQAVKLPHREDVEIAIGLFKDVQNAAFLREQLLRSNTDFEYTFLDASVLLSRKHVLAACSRGVNDWKQGRLKSRNVHSEIVFSFSPNNNISESFRRFGISETTSNIVAIKVGSSLSAVQQHLEANIEGSLTQCSDENLRPLRDEARLRKIYRLEGPKDRPLDWHDEAFVLGSMALKGSIVRDRKRFRSARTPILMPGLSRMLAYLSPAIVGVLQKKSKSSTSIKMSRISQVTYELHILQPQAFT